MPQSILKLNAVITAAATVVGKKEHEGPLGNCFDYYNDKDRFGQDTWEKAESEMQRMALSAAMAKASIAEREVDMLFAGDLLNQCVGSAYGLLSYDIPYFGLYGACSTCAESLLLSSSMITGGLAQVVAAVTSSHNAGAERQFRLPVEYGGQRPPTGQWTVTGAGAFVVMSAEAATERASCPILARITAGMPGIVLDRGIADAANMGAAMAPAAESTLVRYFESCGDVPQDYDLIVTGDLGREGGAILCDLMLTHGLDISERYTDCGILMFDAETQDTHSGGSGCGCSATVLGGHLLPKLASGELHRILFMATGALMSPDSVKQGETIPGVAHLLCIETPRKETQNGLDT